MCRCQISSVQLCVCWTGPLPHLRDRHEDFFQGEWGKHEEREKEKEGGEGGDTYQGAGRYRADTDFDILEFQVPFQNNVLAQTSEFDQK